MYVKKNYKKLTNEQVYKLMMLTLDRFGIAHPQRVDLLPLFREHIPIPMILETDEITVWLDKEYIAYSSIHEHIVHYVYMTRKHIAEEYRRRKDPAVAEAFMEAREILGTNQYYFLKMSDNVR